MLITRLEIHPVNSAKSVQLLLFLTLEQSKYISYFNELPVCCSVFRVDRE